MRAHLATFLDDFRRHGRDLAVVRYVGVRRRQTTYVELARLAGRFAAFLAGRGIQSGDRVVLWAENSAEWIAAFYGCLLRGVLVVPLDAYGSAEFGGRVAQDVQPALVVGDQALLESLPGDWPMLPFEDWEAMLPAQEAGPVAELSLETPLQILFTSGTTGDPKGIVHTHGNVLSSIDPIERGAQRYLRYERFIHPLRILHALPLSHVFGQTMGLWIPPILAAELHMESRPVAAQMMERIRRERISVLAAVPRVLALLQGAVEAEYPALSSRLAAAKGISAGARWWRFRDVHQGFGLKFWAFVTGGGALSGLVEQFWNGLGFVLVQGYGMTETAALITLNHPFHVARGTIGKPLPGREVKLGPEGEVLVRGAMVSGATWTAGAMRPRTDEWLATGDLAEVQSTGELRFLGRKSEVIVTGAGVNIHPEDIEAEVEQEPEIAACAVVAVATPAGPEPCAVVALRGGVSDLELGQARAGEAIRRANVRLAGFQRIRRWLLWSEPDLPRTATGKVRRAAVAGWAAKQGEEAAPRTQGGGWLLQLIARTTGENLPPGGDELRLDGDLHLDSLGRVQLLSALEERLGATLSAEQFTELATVGELRAWMAKGELAPVTPSESSVDATLDGLLQTEPAVPSATVQGEGPAAVLNPPRSETARKPRAAEFVYPRWPWWTPVRWLRVAFLECVLRPLVWLLAAPRVVSGWLDLDGPPKLIIANHVSAYDVPLLLFALPAKIRRRTAVAMSGEMLEDFRRGRNQQPRWLNPTGPLQWLMVTALFNVFPLPRKRDFQRSFRHAGAALDHGFHVIVFPEGARSQEGEMAPFRPGIGLLVRQAAAGVLPLALRGLGELASRRKGWFRSGKIEIVVGKELRFSARDSESGITERLEECVRSMLR